MNLRAFSFMFFWFCSSALSTTVVPPATLSELSGAWLGGSEANSEYLRLELNHSGRGILTVQYVPKERAAAYKVLATHLARYSIQFDLQPQDGAEPVFLQGTAELGGMTLEFGNIYHRWHREVTLEPERDVLSRIEAVTKRAQEVATPPHR